MSNMILDERQRAMLAEMGVRVWMPEPDEAPAQGETPPLAATGSPVPARQGGPETAEPVARNAPSAVESMVNEAPPVAIRPSAPAQRPVPVPVVMPGPASEAFAPRPDGVDTMDWPALRDAVAGCRACGLCQGRRNTVFGVGDVNADWMVIGEAPGEQEDLRGEPFVGPAGQLLDNMLKAIGLSRQAGAEAVADIPTQADGAPRASRGVYIANVLKCRPPGNRNPQPAEVAQCEPYLARQVALVRPRIILAMGRFAVQSLLQTTEPIGRLRGRVHRYQGVPVVVTYHPAYLLRNLPDKAKAWVDLCLAMDVMRQGA